MAPEDNFEKVYRSVCVMAPQIFLEAGSHVGVLLIGHKDGMVHGPVPMVWYNEAEKEILYRRLTFIYQEHSDWYIQIQEAWTLEKSLDDLLGALRPGLNPDRVEALIVAGRHKDGRSYMHRWNITRQDNKVRLSSPKQETGISWSLLDKVILGIDIPLPMTIDGRGRMDVET